MALLVIEYKREYLEKTFGLYTYFRTNSSALEEITKVLNTVHLPNAFINVSH